MTPQLGVALVAIVIVAFCYEVWRASHDKSTISEQVWAFCKQWPPVLFLVGVLCGHLFT